MSLESKIDELIAALDRNTAAQEGTTPEGTAEQPASAEPAKRRGRPAKAASEPAPAAAQTVSTTTAPDRAVSTTTTTTTTTAAAVDVKEVLTQATEAIIKLANEYSRDSAVAILNKHGGTKCSEIKVEKLPLVLAEANAAIAAAQKAKASESLV